MMATGRISKTSVDRLVKSDCDQFLSRRATIGEHGKLIAAEVRAEAKKIVGKASLKEDVAETRATLRRQSTIGELANRYLKDHVTSHNKASTQADARRIVEHRIKPRLGSLKLQALTRARVREWHEGMRETPYEGNRALAYLSKMMSLAAHDWDLLAPNPCKGLKRFPEYKRERFLTEKELAELGAALKRCEKDGLVPDSFASALRVLAVTMCALLTYFDFPREHRTKLHSTNTLERLNGEVKRRANVVGIFPNEAAIIRLVGALLLEQNDEWAIQRRYMSLETLATVDEDATVGLPAIANLHTEFRRSRRSRRHGECALLHHVLGHNRDLGLANGAIVRVHVAINTAGNWGRNTGCRKGRSSSRDSRRVRRLGYGAVRCAASSTGCLATRAPG